MGQSLKNWKHMQVRMPYNAVSPISIRTNGFTIDHCLDFLRESVMCNVDYSLYTVYYRDGLLAHKIPTARKCVNWDVLHGWMLARAGNRDMLQEAE